MCPQIAIRFTEDGDCHPASANWFPTYVADQQSEFVIFTPTTPK